MIPLLALVAGAVAAVALDAIGDATVRLVYGNAAQPAVVVVAEEGNDDDAEL